MPCIAWSKKWEVNIFNAIWNVGFASQHAKSQPSKCSPHGFLCRHCSLSVKAYELPPRPALRASQVDWLVCLEQRSCSSGWSCSVLLYLLTFTVTANTHNAPVRLKHIAPQSVADFSKQLHGQTVTKSTPSSHYIKQTKKQTKTLPKIPQQLTNRIPLPGVNTSLSNTLAYIKHGTWKNYTIFIYLDSFLLSLFALSIQGFAPLLQNLTFPKEQKTTCTKNCRLGSAGECFNNAERLI